MAFREIQQALQTLFRSEDENFLFEVRVPGLKWASGKSYTLSSVYPNTAEGIEDAATDVDQLERVKKPKAIYCALNPIADLERFSNRGDLKPAYQVARDADVRYRRWLFVDIDPERETGASASAVEKAHAKRVAQAVRKKLKAKGFPSPVVCDSGNGYHLLYRVAWPNNDIVHRRIEYFLSQLDEEFSNPHVSIDRSVCNAARITKLYGTMARKGEATAEHPHRRSGLIHVPRQLIPVDPALFASMTKDAPKPKPRIISEFVTYDGPSTSLLDYLSHHGFTDIKAIQGDKIFIQCPFDSEHSDPHDVKTTTVLFDREPWGFECARSHCQGRSITDFTAWLRENSSANPKSGSGEDYKLGFGRNKNTRRKTR